MAMERISAVMAATFLGASVPLVALGGEIDSYSISHSTEWQPDGCFKPDPPSLFVVDRFTYNMAVDEFNSYISDVKAYISCAKSEAEMDTITFRSMLSDSLGRLTNELISEVDSARSDLDLQLMLLRQ